MSQRTGRRVSSDVASLPAHGKKAPKAEKMELGAGDPTDYSNGQDGTKSPAPKMENKHKGPDRTK